MKSFHLVVAFLVAAGAGTNWVGAKISVDYFPPFLTIVMRFLIIAFLLIPWIKPLKKQFFLVLCIGFALGVCQFGFMFLALRISSDVSTLAITNQVYVPFTVILAVILLKEKVKLARWVAIFIAFSGVIIIGFDPIALKQLESLGAVMLSALSLSVASILMRKLKDINVLQLQGWIALIAIMPLLFLSVIFERHLWFEVSIAPTKAWIAFFYGIFAGSLVFHAGWYYLVRKYPLSVVSPLMLLMPVIGVLSGIIVYGDKMTYKIILGGLVTMIGVGVITYFNKETNSDEKSK